jgi:GT2 family glycosyltransferase
MTALRGIPSEVLLVDNVCTDSTVPFIEQCYPNVVLRRNAVRKGYGANHNVNIAEARGEYILIMNSDMVVEPDALLRMLSYMDHNPDIGVLCPKILSSDGTIQHLNKRYATVLDLFLRRFVPNSLRPLFQRRLDHYEMLDVGYDHVCEVESVTGAFMFCRAAVLRALSGFDPRYFMYCEDFDLCRKVQKTHRTVYFPDARVVHYWERSAHKSWYWTWVFVVSAWRYFNKWGYKWF